MEDIRSVRLKKLHGQLGEIAYELTRVQFSHFSAPETWNPAVNVYRCGEQMVVCVDLAGVDTSMLKLEVEHRRLRIRGRREAPEPESAQENRVQVLAMEIDYGPFEREVILPCEVETARVTAEQQNGLLWIYLPLLPQA